jgi:glycosyltransferase involved in cell wall biosynthesis
MAILPYSQKYRDGFIVIRGFVKKKYKMLAVELEPTPYKVDLWNSFVASTLFDVHVLYSTERNYAPDAGHDYCEFPTPLFSFTVFKGGSVYEIFKSTVTYLYLIIRFHPDMVLISGYVDFLPLFAILSCVLTETRFAVHSDVFNNQFPDGRYRYIKLFVRKIIRMLIFRTATAILNCGKKGMASAAIAGCPETKIFDFPYVVDVERIRSDEPIQVPEQCRKDIVSGDIIILFSGRLIPRKGLRTLLQALSTLADINNWVLWIEGSGPLAAEYVSEANKLGIESRCRFLGFCQMSLHSWLLRNSDLVVVPSLRDSWGIVVDEGMQLGKTVITSDETGSGSDRICNGINGLVFSAGDQNQLSDHLRTLLTNPEMCETLADSAMHTAAKYSPRVNVHTIIQILRREKRATNASML